MMLLWCFCVLFEASSLILCRKADDSVNLASNTSCTITDAFVKLLTNKLKLKNITHDSPTRQTFTFLWRPTQSKSFMLSRRLACKILPKQKQMNRPGFSSLNNLVGEMSC